MIMIKRLLFFLLILSPLWAAAQSADKIEDIKNAHRGTPCEVMSPRRADPNATARGVKGQESDIYMIQNLKYKQQDIIRNLS